MKKQLLYLLIGGSLLTASCSRTPENKVTEYTSNAKGFLNGKNNEDGEPVYNVMTLTSVTDDWDGKEDFSPNSGDDKLVKVELSVQSTDGNVDIGMLETNFALYDASTKKTFAPSVSIDGPTFKGLASRYESGFAVFSVPVDTKLENLYIASSSSNSLDVDLSKEKTENLLPLKKMEAPKEKTVAVNSKFEVVDNIFELTKVYTIKSITYNANDEKVKKFHTQNPGNESASIVKVEVEIENKDASKNAWISMPWLISEYGAGIPDYSFGETPSEIKPGKHNFTLYYRTFAGEKVLGLNGENKDGEDFSVKLK
ncbi:hypothetical protein D3C87_41400 [compost metagenome]